jgi:uncharacterized protein YlxW (UPF0749 family)
MERRRAWAVLTPVVLLLAGLLLTTSATTAKGTDLRDDRRPELTNLIAQRKRDVAASKARAGALRGDIEDLTRGQAGTDDRVADQRARGDAFQAAAGLTALHGPGLTVRLDDAPRRADGSRPPGARPDDLVVHQQDVQAVVNALWAGGAEAMSIMGVRVIATSAVRCVGNTLLLDGRVYSPPFEITAIGDVAQMQRALDGAEGVQLFREAADSFGLGYQVKTEADVTVPAYDGSIALRSAR